MSDTSAETVIGQVQARQRMHWELASAYLAAGARVGSWVVVGGLVYRLWGPGAFATLALVRAVLAVLNYSALGLGPAMIHQLANAKDGSARRAIYFSGFALLVLLGLAAGALLAGFAGGFVHLLRPIEQMRADTPALVVWFGAGVILRLMSDAPGAVLQTSRRIVTDNVLLASAEGVWVVLSLVFAWRWRDAVVTVAWAYALAGLMLLVGRLLSAEGSDRLLGGGVHVDRAAQGRMLGFGAGVTLSQLAEYLYAPMNMILINRLISPMAVAVYAPGVQIDAGIFVLVSGIAAVLLPRSAVAHAAGDLVSLRRYYIRGTLVSLTLLVSVSVLVWALSPWIFRIWLGNEMRPTQQILWMMLIHTCIGASAMVGRSVLLAMGRVKAYTVSVWAAGLMNVALAIVFVAVFGWGLKGLVLATIIAVTLRCAVWMPWYVMRELRGATRPNG